MQRMKHNNRQVEILQQYSEGAYECGEEVGFFYGHIKPSPRYMKTILTARSGNSTVQDPMAAAIL